MTKKLYYHKTGGGAEYLCLSRVKGTKDEGDLHTAFIRLDGRPEILRALPVFVEVRGGTVQGVYDETGTPHTLPIVIDYDVIDSGECPVCANEYDGESPCEGCGYDAGKDNALKCAVLMYSQ